MINRKEKTVVLNRASANHPDSFARKTLAASLHSHHPSFPTHSDRTVLLFTRRQANQPAEDTASVHLLHLDHLEKNISVEKTRKESLTSRDPTERMATLRTDRAENSMDTRRSARRAHSSSDESTTRTGRFSLSANPHRRSRSISTNVPRTIISIRRGTKEKWHLSTLPTFPTECRRSFPSAAECPRRSSSSSSSVAPSSSSATTGPTASGDHRPTDLFCPLNCTLIFTLLKGTTDIRRS